MKQLRTTSSSWAGAIALALERAGLDSRSLFAEPRLSGVEPLPQRLDLGR